MLDDERDDELLENDEEEIEEQDEKPEAKLLAGKYKSAEELEEAYQNLQREHGRQADELGQYRSQTVQRQPTQEDEDEEPNFASDVERILWNQNKELRHNLAFIQQSAAQREVEDAFERLETKIGAELDHDMRKKIADIGGKMTGMTTRQAVDYAYKILSFDSTTAGPKGNPAVPTPKERASAVNKLGVNPPAATDSEGAPTLSREDRDLLVQLGFKDAKKIKAIAERAAKRRSAQEEEE